MPATCERMSFCLMQISAPFASISWGILVLSLALMQEERHIENFEKVSQNSYGITLQTLSTVESHWMGALYSGTQPRKVNFVRTQFISTWFMVEACHLDLTYRGNPAWPYTHIFMMTQTQGISSANRSKVYKTLNKRSESYSVSVGERSCLVSVKPFLWNDIVLLCLFLSLPSFFPLQTCIVSSLCFIQR